MSIPKNNFIMDYSKVKFDILVLAGQSNAEGNGISLYKTPFKVKGAFEMSDKNPYGMNVDKDNKYSGLDLVLPVQTVIKPLQERKSGESYYSDFSLYFVNKLLREGKPVGDRKILIVKAAFGGSGFALNQQGVGNPLYERLIQMVDQALALNKDNRIVGMLWHQGEHDAFENSSLNDEDRYNFYYSKLKEQFLAFRNKYSQFDIPIITGGFCDNWKKDYLHQCVAIESATKKVCEDIGNAAFIKTLGLHSNHEDIGNEDTIHFSKKSLKVLGEKYYETFARLN